MYLNGGDGSLYLPILRLGSFTFSVGTTSYGTRDSRCLMMLSRTPRLLSERATNHGAADVSVATNISSRTRVYSSHLSYDLTSIGDSFQILRPSSMRDCRRRVCSSALTSSQYLSRMIPESIISRSNEGTTFRKPRAWSSVQKPITRSTPARLYQLRSKMTISPAAGR